MSLKPEISTELRGFVREVLRETMEGRASAGLPAVEAVRIGNDAELAAFVSHLLDPAVHERVKAGKLRFTLGAAPAIGAALNGVITERTIEKHASGGSLVLAADAVLTPLARDRARKLGLTIERRR